MTVVQEGQYIRSDSWIQWPIYWSAVLVGALAAICAILILGLAGIALGAHRIGEDGRILNWKDFTITALFFSVFGSFIAFVIGGWIAGKIAGILRSEPAILHGALVWVLAVPLLVVLANMGAGPYFGSWFGGLAAIDLNVAVNDPDHAIAVRNSALGAAVALLLGLVGSVIGGWWASGEPMTFTYYRTRNKLYSPTVERGI